MSEPSQSVREAICNRRAQKIKFQQAKVDAVDAMLAASLKEHDEAPKPGEDQELCDYVSYDYAMVEFEKMILGEMLLRFNRDGSRIQEAEELHDVGPSTE